MSNYCSWFRITRDSQFTLMVYINMQSLFLPFLSSLVRQKLKRFGISIALITFAITGVCQSPADQIPAVWVWEIKGNNRSIYLLGEMHFFDAKNSAVIDFQLGEKIYSSSEKIWTEALTATLTAPGNKNNSRRMKSATWTLLQKNILSITEQLMSKKSVVEKKEFYEKALAELDDLNTPRLLSTLDQYALINFALKGQKSNANLQQGFTQKITQIEKHAGAKKTEPLEPIGMVEKMWAVNCDSDEILEKAVSQRLDYFNFNSVNELNSVADIQKIFTQLQTDISSLHKAISRAPDWPLTEMCNVAPRNLLWLPRLKEALDSSGAPISFVVGIGHVGGENGLLALLEKNGYKKIKRIYSISEL